MAEAVNRLETRRGKWSLERLWKELSKQPRDKTLDENNPRTQKMVTGLRPIQQSFSCAEYLFVNIVI
ncbi:predicted protein [Lichtheimia corymbifera JMRC:FSU:9682]|uniref:Uncharacterized protein n=1 Tax=Lichtheimia corymbifera JMRC:FSU:9682 TaxID=1263082 RepID=A0A068SB00_9FUNG|nr:predicted protein [Lichtheimia corymbifera JMRC:FSU:9682]